MVETNFNHDAAVMNTVEILPSLAGILISVTQGAQSQRYHKLSPNEDQLLVESTAIKIEAEARHATEETTSSSPPCKLVPALYVVQPQEPQKLYQNRGRTVQPSAAPIQAAVDKARLPITWRISLDRLLLQFESAAQAVGTANEAEEIAVPVLIPTSYNPLAKSRLSLLHHLSHILRALWTGISREVVTHENMCLRASQQVEVRDVQRLTIGLKVPTTIAGSASMRNAVKVARAVAAARVVVGMKNTAKTPKVRRNPMIRGKAGLIPAMSEVGRIRLPKTLEEEDWLKALDIGKNSSPSLTGTEESTRGVVGTSLNGKGKGKRSESDSTSQISRGKSDSDSDAATMKELSARRLSHFAMGSPSPNRRSNRASRGEIGDSRKTRWRAPSSSKSSNKNRDARRRGSNEPWSFANA